MSTPRRPAPQNTTSTSSAKADPAVTVVHVDYDIKRAVADAHKISTSTSSTSTSTTTTVLRSAIAPMLLSKKEEKLEYGVVIHGAVGMQQRPRASFLLVGAKGKMGEKREYAETRDHETGIKLTSATSGVGGLWHIAPLPVLESKHESKHESKQGNYLVFTTSDFDRTLIRYRLLTTLPQLDISVRAHGIADIRNQTTWIPPCIFDPAQLGQPAHLGGRIMTGDGWRRRGYTVFSRTFDDQGHAHTGSPLPVTNSTQYVAISPDQTQFVTGSGISGQAALYTRVNTASAFANPHYLGIPDSQFICAAWFSDSRRFLAGCNGKNIRLVDSQYPQFILNFSMGVEIRAVLPLGNTAYGACSFADGSVRICDFSMPMWELQSSGEMPRVAATANSSSSSSSSSTTSTPIHDQNVRFSPPAYVSTIVEPSTASTNTTCVASVSQAAGRTTLLYHVIGTSGLTFFQLNTRIPDRLERALREIISGASAEGIPIVLADIVISYVHHLAAAAVNPSPVVDFSSTAYNAP